MKLYRVAKRLLAVGLIAGLQLTAMPLPAMAQVVDEAQSVRGEKTESSLSPEVQKSLATATLARYVSVGSAIDNALLSLTQDVSPASAKVQRLTKIRGLHKKTYTMQEKVAVVIEQPVANSHITTKVTDASGKAVSVKVETLKKDDALVVSLIPPQHLRPGKYSLLVEDGATEQKIVQDFTWGVLAINTNKSVYQPGEKARLAIAVLDDMGKMVCEAVVALRIVNQEAREETVLSTKDGSITVNPECQIKDITEKPDYEATYTVGDEGVYSMTLTAETQNGTHTISDTFWVAEHSPFVIERYTATRIYPAHAYPVDVTITANEDFTGTVVETVPESFEVIKDEKQDAKSYDEVTLGTASVTPTSSVLGAATSLSLPFAGNHEVSQLFGDEVTDPLMKKKYEQYGVIGHDGVDFSLPSGTEVLTVDDGKVVSVEEKGDYGTTLVIEHTWGKSYYGHLSKIVVSESDTVRRGEKVALSGSTGLSTAPHLHFGIKLKDNNAKNGYYGKIDPSPLLGVTKVAEVKGVSERTDDTVKMVSWDVSLKKGESVTIGYTYKAPYVSPQFYTLGPLRLYNRNAYVFGESRKWQIAVDDTASYTVSDGSSTATTTSGACDTSLTNGTISDGAQGTVIRSVCVGRSDTPVVKWNKTLTWEAMGIPAGSTITQVDGSFKYRVAQESHTATQAVGTMQLRDSTDAADCAASVLEASFDPGAVNASYTTRNSTGAVNVSAGCQASTTSVTIRLNMSPVTGNNASATSEIRADDISLSITYTPPAPDLQQIHYRWRNDDGSESGATFRRGEDTAMSRTQNTTMRLRLAVSNEGAATATSTTYRLDYAAQAGGACGGGDETFAAVPVTPTTEPFDIQADASGITDGSATSNVSGGLTDENTTFVAGQYKDTGNTTSGITLTTSQFTELEYALQANSNSVIGTTYCFRVSNAGSTTNMSYPVYAEWTVGEPTMTQNHYRWRNDDGGEATLTGQTVTLHPTGQGNYTGWTATGCTENTGEWDCVNDNNTGSGAAGADDGGTTRLATTTGSARSSFTLDNNLVPTTATITQLQIFVVGAEVSGSGGDATTTAFYRLNSSDTDCSSTSAFGGTTYTTQSCTFSGLSLTQSDLNNLEIGILFDGNDPTISKVYVTVTYNTTGATWKQNEDTAHSSQPSGERIRLRVEVANTGDVAAVRRLRLEYAEQTGGTCGDEVFVAVPTSSGSPFQMTDSSYFANEEATTTQLTATGSFVAGKMLDTANAPASGTSIASGSYIENEYNFLIDSTAAEKTYCFKVTDNGTDLDAYTSYAVLGVSAAGPTLAQTMRHGKWFNTSGVRQPFTF